MGGDYHCLLLTQFLNKLPYFRYLVGIKARGGLVQEKYLGVVDHGHGQARPLAVALGELADGTMKDLPDAAGLHDAAQGFLETPARDAPDTGGESQQLVNHHLRIQGIQLGQVTDAGTQLG